MTERDAKHFFLRSLYDYINSKHSGNLLLSNIASANPDTNLGQISRICEGLKNAGWINAVMFTGGDGIITEVNSIAIDYVEQNILPNIELKDDIAHIKQLESDYSCLLNSPEDNANLRETIEAFHKWYAAAAILFSKYFDSSDPDFLKFKNADCSGNGYVLEHVYDSIRSNVSVLISKLESISIGKQQTKVIEPKSMDSKELSKDIFIVHGHDDLAINEVKVFLLEIGFNPIVLREQPNEGQTIIEKIEKYTNVGFGIVLYTPCDEGKAKEQAEYRNRARQNVVFEHGYFCAKLGRNHVCALVKGDLEIPGDLGGVVYTPMSSDWKFKVAKELRAAGYQFDANKLL